MITWRMIYISALVIFGVLLILGLISLLFASSKFNIEFFILDFVGIIVVLIGLEVDRRG